MSKSINTVILFDWKTVIYIYVCGKCRTQFMLSMEKSVTFTGTCANEIIPSINCSFVCKAKEERHVRINCIICSLWKSLNSDSIIPPISTKQTTTSHFNSLNIKKTTTYDVRIPGPYLEQAQNCGRVMPVNSTPPHVVIVGSPITDISKP